MERNLPKDILIKRVYDAGDDLQRQLKSRLHTTDPVLRRLIDYLVTNAVFDLEHAIEVEAENVLSYRRDGAAKKEKP